VLVVLLTAGIALAGYLGAPAAAIVVACIVHTALLAVAWGVWNTKP
jgi:hypothetical protein